MVFLWPGLPKKIWEFWAPSHPLQRKPQGRLSCFPAGVQNSLGGGSGENLGCKHRTLRPGTLWPNRPGERPQNRAGPVWVVPNRFSTLGNTRQRGPETVRKRFENGSKTVRIFEKGSKRVRKGFEKGSKTVRIFEKGSKRVRKRFENGSRPFPEPFWNPFWIEFSKRVRKGFENGSNFRKGFENGSNFRKGFEKGSKTVRKRFETLFGTVLEPFLDATCHLPGTVFEPVWGTVSEPFQNRFRTLSRSRVGFSEPSPSCFRCFLGVLVGLGPMLSGSHRSTHNASDFASRVRQQRESESQAFRIARS